MHHFPQYIADPDQLPQYTTQAAKGQERLQYLLTLVKERRLLSLDERIKERFEEDPNEAYALLEHLLVEYVALALGDVEDPEHDDFDISRCNTTRLSPGDLATVVAEWARYQSVGAVEQFADEVRRQVPL